MTSHIDHPGQDQPVIKPTNNLFHLDCFDLNAKSNALALLCGKHLGTGISRSVFEIRYSDEYVVKIEQGNGMFQNILEWKIWNMSRDYPLVRECLAPCVDISSCGTVLIMRKTIRPKESVKEAMFPKWMQDLSSYNTGMIGDRLVSHDYGLVVPNSDFGKITKHRIGW